MYNRRNLNKEPLLQRWQDIFDQKPGIMKKWEIEIFYV